MESTYHLPTTLSYIKNFFENDFQNRVNFYETEDNLIADSLDQQNIEIRFLHFYILL